MQKHSRALSPLAPGDGLIPLKVVSLSSTELLPGPQRKARSQWVSNSPRAAGVAEAVGDTPRARTQRGRLAQVLEALTAQPRVPFPGAAAAQAPASRTSSGGRCRRILRRMLPAGRGGDCHLGSSALALGSSFSSHDPQRHRGHASSLLSGALTQLKGRMRTETSRRKVSDAFVSF